MTTRFITSGDFPAGTWTGQQLSSGEADGRYYAVDRNAAAKNTWAAADYLTDNVGATSTEWNGSTLPTGMTTSSTTITVATSGIQTWATTASTQYIAVNKIVNITSGGVGKTAAQSSDIYFINCVIIVSGAEAWPNLAIGAFASAGSNDRTLNYAPTTTGSIGTNGGMMFWGCTFITTNTNVWGFGPSEMIGCTFSDNPSKPSTGNPALIAIAEGGRYIDTDLGGPDTTTSPSILSSWQVYAIPGAFQGIRHYQITVGNIGVYAAGADNPLLLNYPVFEVIEQVSLYQANTPLNISGNRPIFIIGGLAAGNSAETWMANLGAGTTYDGTWRFGWGGNAGAWERGGSGFLNLQEIRMTFQDFDLNAIRNVRFRTYSNFSPSPASTSIAARLRTQTTTNRDLVQEFITDTNGLLTTSRYSFDGAATFSSGSFNSLSGQTSATVGSADWNVTAVLSRPTRSNTPLLMAQIGRMTGLNTPAYINCTHNWTARSFTHGFLTAGTIDHGAAALLDTNLLDLGSAQTAALVDGIKTAAITAYNATTTGNIDTYWNGVFTGAVNNDLEDTYGVARYLWYVHTGVTSTAAGALLPTFTPTSIDFGADDIVLSSGAATWAAWSADTWTLRTLVLSGMGTIITTGDVTLAANNQPDAAGQWVGYQAATINLSGNKTVRLALAATTEITGLLTTGTVAEGVAVGFGTSTAVTMTGDIEFDTVTLSGTLTLTPGAAGRSLTFRNTNDVSALTLVNTTPATVINVVNWTGGALPAGFQASNIYSLEVIYSGAAAPPAARPVERFYVDGTLVSTPTPTVVAGTLFYELVIQPGQVVDYVNFSDGYLPAVNQGVSGDYSDVLTLLPEENIDFGVTFTASDQTFIGTYTVSQTTPSAGESRLNIITDTTVQRLALDTRQDKTLLRRAMENTTNNAAWYAAIAAGTAQLPQAFFRFDPDGTSKTNIATNSILANKGINNTAVVQVAVWNTDSGGINQYDWNTAGGALTGDVGTNIIYPLLSPGPIAIVTTGQLQEFADILEPDLTVINDNIQDASLLIPAARTLP